jgi:hypothetical protein
MFGLPGGGEGFGSGGVGSVGGTGGEGAGSGTGMFGSGGCCDFHWGSLPAGFLKAIGSSLL